MTSDMGRYNECFGERRVIWGNAFSFTWESSLNKEGQVGGLKASKMGLI